MHILLSFFHIHFELRATRQEVFIHLQTGSRTRLLYEREFLDTFTCAECDQEVEADGQLLKLCALHRDVFVETWYSRWMNKK